MQSKQKTTSQPKTRLIILGSVLAVILLVTVFILLRSPERSVTAYCEAYKEENAKLADAQGDTYAVAVFDHKSSNPGDFATAFSRLERVAPNEIRSDVKTLQQIFQKIDEDPSQALGASLSGISAESNVKEWTASHCNL